MTPAAIAMPLERIGEVASTVRADCAADATALDRTPFTPRGMGETFGANLAMIAALAQLIEHLAEHVQELERELANRSQVPS